MNGCKRTAKIHDIAMAHAVAKLQAPDFARLTNKKIRRMHRALFPVRRLK